MVGRIVEGNRILKNSGEKLRQMREKRRNKDEI